MVRSAGNGRGRERMYMKVEREETDNWEMEVRTARDKGRKD